MNSRNGWLVILLALVTVVGAVACQTIQKPADGPTESTANVENTPSPAGTPPHTPDPNTIRLTNGEWPPYLSEDLEQYGLASQIVTEAFALEGIEVEYGFFPWARAYELAERGEWDGSVVWFHTLEREKVFYHSDPVIYSTHVFWHRKDNPFDWRTLDELQGVTIGATSGYWYEEAFRQAEQAGRLKVEWAPKDEMNFEKLVSGRVDIFSQDLYVGCSMLQKNFTPEQIQLLTYHPQPVRVDPGHLLLSRQVERNGEMIRVFNRGLSRLRESGRVDEILAETLGDACLAELELKVP